MVKHTANPIATVISLPIHSSFNFGAGEYNRFRSAINLRPVIPPKLGKNSNLINYIIIPVIYELDVTQESSGTFGVGDVNYSAFFTPSKAGKITRDIGPACSIPTRSSNLPGSTEFGIGPTLIVLTMPDNSALGYTANNVASFQNRGLNYLLSKVITIYTFPSTWFVQMPHAITDNWNALEGQKCTVALGVSVGKLVVFGKQLVEFIGGVAYYIERSDNGAKWQLFFPTVFFFPRKAKS